MRIAMVSTPFVSVPPVGYGGTELVVHELTEGLIERGHEVTLFATGESRTRGELRHLYPKAQWPVDPITDFNHVSWALRQVLSEDFDVVHAHSSTALAIGRFLPDIPLFYTLHHERNEPLSRFYSYFPNVYYIAISEDQRSREVPLPCMETIHHGLSPDRFRWLPQAEEYVAFIGRFAPVKGPHTAIDVAARAGVEIRVGGETHSVDRAFGEAEVEPRLSLPHVRFLGSVKGDGKRALLRSARALLFPIDWNEPFGLVLIEAMLSGCPPVAFPRGSVHELIEHGVTGFIANDEDEMVELLRKGSVLDRFDRRRCRERAVERFGTRRMVEEHEKYYARAVAAVTAGSAAPDPGAFEPVWPIAGAGNRPSDAAEQS